MLYQQDTIVNEKQPYHFILADPRIAELREMPRSFSIKLHSETQVSGRLGMSGGRSPRHALPPPPSHHHLYTFISSIDYKVFIVLQCHLKDHLCRKVK